MPYSSILDVCELETIEPNVLYQSVHKPERMGNMAAIAYGGCALAFACATAHQGISGDHRMYSFVGNYLGPALIDRQLRCRIQNIRSTRTFATRLVTVSQIQDDGSDRACLVALADFQLPEPASMLTYSRPPLAPRSALPGQCPTPEVALNRLRDSGVMKPAHEKARNVVFGLGLKLFDYRIVEESLFAQNLNGIIHKAKTTQDNRNITEKYASDWWRTTVPLESRSQHAATLAFQMDGALSFAPLSFSHQSMADAGACSSLEFALRIFDNDFRCDDWLMREIRTHTAGVGRTYTEGTCYDQHGKMIASMTQQCILRPAKAKSAKL